MCPAFSTSTMAISGCSARIRPVFGVNDAAFACGHQQRRHGQQRVVAVAVHLMKIVVGALDRRLVAGVQPLGAQPALLFAPGRAEGAHLLGAHARQRLPDRVGVPRPLAGIGAAAGAGNRRIDQHQPPHAGRLQNGGAQGEAGAHRMAEQGVTVQAQRGGEGVDVLRAGLRVISQFRAAGRQTAAAHVEHVDVVFFPSRSATKPQVIAGLVMPGIRISAGPWPP